MRTLSEIDREIATTIESYRNSVARLEQLNDERDQAHAIEKAEQQMAQNCDATLRRFLRGEWIAGTGGRLYWCSDQQALIEPTTADDMEAVDYLVAQGVLATGFRGGPR